MENRKTEMVQEYPENMPHIGADGFWYVGQTYTGVRASGSDGLTPRIGADGYWYIGDKNTEVQAAGERGTKGDKGDTGESGLRGAQGPIGPEGPQGIQGPIGPHGIEGPMGPQGKQGIIGPKGETGPVNLYNGLDIGKTGYALDAQQGKVLAEEVRNVNHNLSGVDGSIHNPGGLTINEFYSRRHGNLAIAGGAVRNKETLPPNTDTGYAMFQLGIRPALYIDISFTIFGTNTVLAGYIKPDGWVHIRPIETLNANVFLIFNFSYPCV